MYGYILSNQYISCPILYIHTVIMTNESVAEQY